MSAALAVAPDPVREVPRRVVLLGGSGRNEYAAALHEQLGVRSLGDLLATVAGADAAATEFTVVGPEVPAAAQTPASGWEQHGPHKVRHLRGRLHDLELAPFDVCIALHAGFAVPRYRGEWRQTLDLLAQHGSLLVASAYDETEESSNRQMLQTVAAHSDGCEARVLHSGPSDFGALQGRPGLGKLHYAATCVVFVGPRNRSHCDVIASDAKHCLTTPMVRSSVFACLERFAERIRR